MDVFVTEQAHLSDTLDADYYCAEATSADEENTFEVRWDITDPNAEEEENACDWDDFYVVDGDRVITEGVRVWEPLHGDYEHVAEPGAPGKWQDRRTQEVLEEDEPEM